MKLHIPTKLLTLVIGAMSFAAAEGKVFTKNEKLGELNDDWINVQACSVEVDSVNGGTGAVAVSVVSQLQDGRKKPAYLKVNGNLVLKSDTYLQGNNSSNDATLIANGISTDGSGYMEFINANVRALEGDVTLTGKYYPEDGFISRVTVENTELTAEKGDVNLKYSAMESGSISASSGDVNISHSNVNVTDRLSAQTVNINEDGALTITDAERVEFDELFVNEGASFGVDGATIVFNEGSSITLGEGAKLTSFDNVSFEFILDTDSITDGGAAYSFDIFKGIENLTDADSIAVIGDFEEAFAAGDIEFTLKGVNAAGDLIDLDTGSANVSFANGSFTINSTVSVPEPTTATLSLLALAALAARRRRR